MRQDVCFCRLRSSPAGFLSAETVVTICCKPSVNPLWCSTVKEFWMAGFRPSPTNQCAGRQKLEPIPTASSNAADPRTRKFRHEIARHGFSGSFELLCLAVMFQEPGRMLRSSHVSRVIGLDARMEDRSPLSKFNSHRKDERTQSWINTAFGARPLFWWKFGSLTNPRVPWILQA
jgi:hypothetical protein